MSHFQDKVVLITGGGSGIGRAVGEEMVAQGAKVVLADIDEERVQGVAAELGCDALGLDVRDFDAFVGVVQRVEQMVGPVDVLVNNAGIALVGEARTFDHADWTRVLDVNLYGVVNGVHAVYSTMIERGHGQIINIGSIAGMFPVAGMASYVASKYAVVGLSHSLRAEAREHGVRINVVCPGIIKTRMYDEVPIKQGNRDALRAQIPSVMPVDKCARAIVRGAARDKATILITPMARVLNALFRVSPSLAHLINGASFRRLAKQLGAS